MKLLAFLLFSLYIFYVKSEECLKDKYVPDSHPCLRICFNRTDTICANNGKCYFNFKNGCTMNNRNCYSIARKWPVFKFISKGPCVNPTLRRCLNSPAPAPAPETAPAP
nr:uncharacterized protein LOC108074389 [Drosophila kikkawai]